jgi:hypothetical protein
MTVLAIVFDCDYIKLIDVEPTVLAMGFKCERITKQNNNFIVYQSDQYTDALVDFTKFSNKKVTEHNIYKGIYYVIGY